MRNISILFLMLFYVSSGLAAEKLPDDVVSGWSFKKSLPQNYKQHGYRVVNNVNELPVRTGAYSLRFEVRSGDCGYHKQASDCDRDRERHELSSANASDLMVDGEYWIGWSIYLPMDYPIVYPTKTAFAQFHQLAGRPAWMFQNKDGGLWIDNHLGLGLFGNLLSNNYSMLLSDDQMRGQWNDIAVNVKWSAQKDGFFRVFLNGNQKPVYDWSGATKTKGKSVYFKFGVYRSYLQRWQKAKGKNNLPTQVVYFDEVRRGQKRADIEPKQ